MRQVQWSLMFVAFLAAGACSHSSSGPSSPISPSVDLASPSPSSSGATVNGQVQGSSRSAMTVNVLGTAKTAAVDSAGRFRLDDVPPGNVELRFEGTGTDVRVGVGDVTARERVELTILINGGAGVVAALGHLLSDGRADVRGMITSIDSAGRSLSIGAILVMVPTTAEIKERGSARAFNDLAVQQRVHIEGIVSGSAITAREVEIEDERGNDDNGNGDDEEDDAEFTGTVTAIRGDCPALSLTVDGRTVRTDGTTSFLRMTCSTLAVGAAVEVEGSTQPDGSVLANKVQLEDAEDDGDDQDDEDEAEFRGSVAGLGGSCPSLTMTVGGRGVRTNGSTSFERGVCGDVRTGVLLQVKGAPNADGTVTATRVRFED